jgi:hypothetical protein
MEDDARSDSGVSTLRSDGARSSGDERSGSRSSAISDDRWVRGRRGGQNDDLLPLTLGGGGADLGCSDKYVTS